MLNYTIEFYRSVKKRVVGHQETIHLISLRLLQIEGLQKGCCPPAHCSRGR